MQDWIEEVILKKGGMIEGLLVESPLPRICTVTLISIAWPPGLIETDVPRSQKGRFKLTGIPFGKYRLEALAAGYEMVNPGMILTIDSPQMASVLVQMRRTSNQDNS